MPSETQLTPAEKWGEIDVPYPDFQEAAWQHDETGRIVVVEREPGPHDTRRSGWYVALVPAGHPQSAEILGRIESGLEDAEQAINEAEAIIAAGKAEEYANV